MHTSFNLFNFLLNEKEILEQNHAGNLDLFHKIWFLKKKIQNQGVLTRTENLLNNSLASIKSDCESIILDSNVQSRILNINDCNPNLDSNRIRINTSHYGYFHIQNLISEDLTDFNQKYVYYLIILEIIRLIENKNNFYFHSLIFIYYKDILNSDFFWSLLVISEKLDNLKNSQIVDSQVLLDLEVGLSSICSNSTTNSISLFISHFKNLSIQFLKKEIIDIKVIKGIPLI